MPDPARIDSPLAMLLKGGYITQPAAEACAAAVAPAYPVPRRPSRALIPLGQFPDPRPEAGNRAALFRRGWLRKGGGAFLIAPSGVGKSVWTTQAAICWALGKPAFGVAPVRPLKICVIQAEDDREEIAGFRNAVRFGLVTEYGFDEAEVDMALGTHNPETARVFFHKAVGLWGEDFVNELGAILDSRPDIDLVIVNPFQSYFGGDCSKNAELSRFFRSWLDREIKDPADEGNDRAAVLFVHHTNKPPNDRDLRAEWGADQFAAYIGAGGAEIVNWARAVLSLMPTGVPGVFRLIAGKRGQRLGWTDAGGRPVFCKVIKHADNGCVYWREGTPEDVQALTAAPGGKRPPVNKPKFTALSALSYVNEHPGLAERRYRDEAARKMECSGGTVQNKLHEAAENGWLSVRTEGGSKFYNVTEAGRVALSEAVF